MTKRNSSLKRFEEEISWEEKAKINPLYAVMSEEIFQTAEAEPTPEQLNLFYHKGKKIWNRYFADVFSQYSDPVSVKVLEYGCGMGRVLHVPASSGAACIGVDISTTQLALAKKYMPGHENARFTPVYTQNAIDVPDNSIDFVYSFAVLQHILRTSDLHFAFSEMIRVTRKGGMLKVQVPVVAPYFNHRYQFLRRINFEEKSLLIYLKKNFFNIPIVRLVRHNNWGGAAYYQEFEKLIHFLETRAVHVNQVTFDEGGFALSTATKL